MDEGCCPEGPLAEEQRGKQLDREVASGSEGCPPRDGVRLQEACREDGEKGLDVLSNWERTSWGHVRCPVQRGGLQRVAHLVPQC